MRIDEHFHFTVSSTATAVFNINSALIIDLFPSGQSARATAMNNLMRCSVGALGVSLVDPLISRAGRRLAFIILAALTAGMTPLLWVEARWGKKWRMEREKRREGDEEVAS